MWFKGHDAFLIIVFYVSIFYVWFSCIEPSQIWYSAVYSLEPKMCIFTFSYLADTFKPNQLITEAENNQRILSNIWVTYKNVKCYATMSSKQRVGGQGPLIS